MEDKELGNFLYFSPASHHPLRTWSIKYAPIASHQKHKLFFLLLYHVCICFLFFFKLWNKQVHWWCYRRTLSTVARFSLHTRDRFEKSLFWTTFVYFCSSCVFMTSGAPPRCCISPSLQIQGLFPVFFQYLWCCSKLSFLLWNWKGSSYTKYRWMLSVDSRLFNSFSDEQGKS